MIRRMLGAAQLNAATYEEVEHDSGATLQALLVVVLVTIASTVGRLWSGDDINVVSALGLGVVRGVMTWALLALMIWIIGSTLLRTEHTQANWGQVARGTAFAQTPGILSLLALILWPDLIYFATFVWTFAAMLVAVRQTLDYKSTWRAFFVVLPAFIVTVVASAILFLFLT